MVFWQIPNVHLKTEGRFCPWKWSGKEQIVLGLFAEAGVQQLSFVWLLPASRTDDILEGRTGMWFGGAGASGTRFWNFYQCNTFTSQRSLFSHLLNVLCSFIIFFDQRPTYSKQYIYILLNKIKKWFLVISLEELLRCLCSLCMIEWEESMLQLILINNTKK